MKAKLAIVGCGTPAQKWHIPTLAELDKRDRVEFVALCDLDENLARTMGEQYEVPWYTSIDEMLDRHPDIQAVDIVTGDPSHHALGKLLAEKGKHVMVEKPMALTLPCCDAIIEACDRNGVHFEVAENYFRMPKQRAIVKLITEGVLGEIVRVDFHDVKNNMAFEHEVTHRGMTSPLHAFGNSSGMCMDMGSHRLSQLRLYAQSEPVQISGTVNRYRAGETMLKEDFAHAMIQFESGCFGVYETSRVGENQAFYQITGTRGGILDTKWTDPHLPLRLRIGDDYQDIPVETERKTIDGVDVVQRIVVHTDPQIIYENPFRDCAIDDWCIGHASELMSLADAALDKAPPEYGLGGRKDVEMAMAIYESSMNDMMPVKLPLTETTGYERQLHQDYEDKFGRPIV